MYSLYRAWLMRDAVAAATLAAPPDVVVNVGGGSGAGGSGAARQFAAHRSVLASHSGYLKALLAACAESDAGRAEGRAGGASGTISVPNVSPEAFAPLLSFMYTGYLDVTHDNIYGVLLATHLLHMPRALDLCRAFLLQHQHRPPAPPLPPPPARTASSSLPTLVKPIPSRKMLPMLLGLGGLPAPPPPAPGPFWPPTASTYHQALAVPPAPPVPMPAPHPLLLRGASGSASGDGDPSSPFHCLLPVAADESPHEEPARPRPAASPDRRRSRSPLAGPSTSAASRLALAKSAAPCSPSPPSSVSPCLSGTSFSSDDRHVVSTPPSAPTPAPATGPKPKRVGGGLSHKTSGGRSKETYNNGNDASTSSASRVIIDVACCDGPVRFHRVLNDNYGLTLEDILAASEASDAPATPEAPTERAATNNAPPAAPSGEARADAPPADKAKPTALQGANETVYTCLYCNHTFKSHYCYQKHARRHINPVTLDLARLADKLAVAAKAADSSSEKEVSKADKGASGGSSADKSGGSGSGSGSGSGTGGVRREVRLLDMNVQYYPCKTCGSKFPSYYFVHKHRKMCHANEDSSAESVGVSSSNDDSSHQPPAGPPTAVASV